MKAKSVLRNITIIFGIVSLFSVLVMGLALTDIKHDYVSAEVIEKSAPQPVELPEWASCTLEWNLAGFAFWIVLIFHVLLLTTVILYRKNSPEKAKK